MEPLRSHKIADRISIFSSDLRFILVINRVGLRKGVLLPINLPLQRRLLLDIDRILTNLGASATDSTERLVLCSMVPARRA